MPDDNITIPEPSNNLKKVLGNHELSDEQKRMDDRDGLPNHH